MANHKCVWFGGTKGTEIPEVLRMAQVNVEKDAIKVLGAYVGEDEKVDPLLLEKLQKHKTIFRRLSQMGASNVSTILLSKCVNIRHRFHIRTHTPNASEAMAKEFDGEVDKVLKTWFGPMTQDQLDWARLPLRMGGLGLPSTDALRAAAYQASRSVAFEQPKFLSAQVTPSESDTAPVAEMTAVEVKMHKEVKERLRKNKKFARIMDATTKKGSYTWIQANERLVPSRKFTLAVMPRLGMGHPRLPESLTCPGCRVLLNSATALTHIPGCVRCAGMNTTVKHNALVRYIHNMCLRAGIPCELEPRQFSTYVCTSCSEVIREERRREHIATCKGSTLHRSGPDLVIYWATGEIFYDLTVVHDLAPSLAGTTPAKAIKDAIARKNTKYVSSNMFAEEQFACLPVLSSGSLHARTRELLRLLAEKISIEPSKVENDFILLLQEMNGNILLGQLRKYLSQSHGDDICAF